MDIEIGIEWKLLEFVWMVHFLEFELEEVYKFFFPFAGCGENFSTGWKWNINIWNQSRTAEPELESGFLSHSLHVFLIACRPAENNRTLNTTDLTRFWGKASTKTGLGTKDLKFHRLSNVSSCHMLHVLLTRAVGSKSWQNIHLCRTLDLPSP